MPVVIEFTKMHGAGNDFVIVDARASALDLSPRRIAALANRRTGIGWDQFIRLAPPPAAGDADVTMEIFNPDGSEAGACGNATRCVAALLAAETGQTELVIATIAGNLPAEILPHGQVRVDMGRPRLEWSDIPLACPQDTLHLNLPGDPAAASMGNPHATFFVPDLDAIDIARKGPAFEQNPLFPDRANIGFARIFSPDRIFLKVWERGAGQTLACGSGACATLVNAHRRGLTARAATVVMDGGELLIEWAANNHVLMTGPAVTSFTGTFDPDAFAA